MEEYSKEPKINQDLIDLTKDIVTLREKHAELKKQAAGIWMEEQQLENKLVDQLEVLNLRNFRHKEFGLISVGQRIWARITDVKKAKEYFESQGISSSLLEERIKQEGGQARLNEIIRDCVESGHIIPAGLDFSNKATIRITKA